MSYSYQVNYYNISISEIDDDANNFYIKVTYKDNIIFNDIEFLNMTSNSTIDTKDAYQIITRCLSNSDKSCYTVNISVNSDNTIRIVFHASVGGFLYITYEAILTKQTTIIDDNVNIINTNIQLSDRCNLLEEQNKQLTNMIDILSFAEICIYSHYINPVYVSLNVQEISDHIASGCVQFNLNKIKLLYNLKKLTINYGFYNNILDNDFQSNSLIYLDINVQYITILDWIQKFPNLETIVIRSCAQLKGIPTLLSSYNHNIKYIIVIL